jgi:hypothetical protein
MADDPLPLLPHEEPLPPRTDLWIAAACLVFSVAVLVLSWQMPTYTEQGGQLYTAPGLVAAVDRGPCRDRNLSLVQCKFRTITAQRESPLLAQIEPAEMSAIWPLLEAKRSQGTASASPGKQPSGTAVFLEDG